MPKSGWIKLNSENALEIEIRNIRAEIIPIILNEYVPGYSDTMHNNRYRLSVYELKTEQGKHVYEIPLSAFSTPAWWYKNNHINKQDLPDFNPQKIKNICIQNCILLNLNTKDTIEIIGLRVYSTHTFLTWLIIALTGIWIFSASIYFILKKKEIAVFIPYIATESDIRLPDDWERIQSFISSNYIKEIDMEIMEKELGIARHKIAILIKENTSLIFKQYLNQIRVAEAKRLLIETNLLVGEIADKVGFGHISNFNRVFKEYSGQSPSEVRKYLNVKE